VAKKHLELTSTEREQAAKLLESNLPIKAEGAARLIRNMFDVPKDTVLGRELGTIVRMSSQKVTLSDGIWYYPKGDLPEDVQKQLAKTKRRGRTTKAEKRPTGWGDAELVEHPGGDSVGVIVEGSGFRYEPSQRYKRILLDPE